MQRLCSSPVLKFTQVFKTESSVSSSYNVQSQLDTPKITENVS